MSPIYIYPCLYLLFRLLFLYLVVALVNLFYCAESNHLFHSTSPSYPTRSLPLNTPPSHLHTPWLLRESTRNLLTWAGMLFPRLSLRCVVVRCSHPTTLRGGFKTTIRGYTILTDSVTRPRPALLALLERIWYDTPSPSPRSRDSRS